MANLDAIMDLEEPLDIHSFETSEGAKPEVEIKLKYYEGSPVIKQLKNYCFIVYQWIIDIGKSFCKIISEIRD